MRPWLTRTLIGVFGASVLFGGLAACSHHHHRGGWAMTDADAAKLRERVIDKATRELALDDAQKAKLGVLADAVKTQRDALRAGISDPRAELQSLVAGAQFDRAKAQALIDGKTAAVHDKAPVIVNAFADFYDSLKPDQQQKLRDFMAHGRGHHGWRG
ncbi:MAG: Spy/CpxP family protein refolding chaperone [Burkholderiales bacterium]|nr:Spy/CpxP family protein refolding chaperone [Burkholderiales bacterium]